MSLFTRTVRVKNAATLAAAIRFANEICAHVNKTYHVKMRFGTEVFGHAKLTGFLDFDRVDQSLALNQKMLLDNEYQTLLGKGKELWVEGSMKDRLVRMVP